MTTVKVFIGSNADSQTLSLQAKAELLGLLFPSLGHCCLADTVRLNANFEGSFAVKSSNHLYEGPHHKHKGMDLLKQHHE